MWESGTTPFLVACTVVAFVSTGGFCLCWTGQSVGGSVRPIRRALLWCELYVVGGGTRVGGHVGRRVYPIVIRVHVGWVRRV